MLWGHYSCNLHGVADPTTVPEQRFCMHCKPNNSRNCAVRKECSNDSDEYSRAGGNVNKNAMCGEASSTNGRNPPRPLPPDDPNRHGDSLGR
eukprot:2530028-Amphidinium_carterae.1